MNKNVKCEIWLKTRKDHSGFYIAIYEPTGHDWDIAKSQFGDWVVSGPMMGEGSEFRTKKDAILAIQNIIENM